MIKWRYENMIPLDHSIGSWNCRGEGQKLVGLGGLEPPTSPLSGVRSNHLSYRPNFCPADLQAKPSPTSPCSLQLLWGAL